MEAELDLMAARLGLHPRERRRLMPTQVRELWDGAMWRRSRSIDVVSVAVAWIVNRIPLNDTSVASTDVARSVIGYVPFNDDEEGG